MKSENLKYWLGFAKLGYSGSTFLSKLWQNFGCVKEAWFANVTDILEIEGIRCDTAEKFVAARKSINFEKICEEVEKKDVSITTIEDENYPELLKHIYNPPTVLFIKGSLDICNLDRTLAIVGSRKASSYIQDIIAKIVTEISTSEATIVSGMALGVDTYAHKAALKNGLKTIAVLGCGFDNVYPKSNQKLFSEIIDRNGAVISEYYPTEEPETWKFPQRNRIVSGLSKGTLIAEASLKSGALITARLCLEQNRELMCIPGLVTNPNTEGIHKLLKDGAGVVTCGEDIYNYLNWQFTEENGVDIKPKIKFLDNEEKVYEILNLEPVKIDAILQKSGLSIDNLLITLTTLELKGVIKQLPGEYYTISSQ